MKSSIKSVLLLSAVALLLAACGTVGTSTPSSAPSSPPPSVAPSDAPSEAPSEAPEETEAPGPVVIGTLTIVGAAVDGPGESLASAMGGDLSEPVFVRGFVFKDSDGQVYFADSLDADSERVLVAEYPTDGPTWDLANAEVTGLQESDGILFYENSAIYGTLSLI